MTDDQHPGRPAEISFISLATRIDYLIRHDQRITIEEIAENIAANIGTQLLSVTSSRTSKQCKVGPEIVNAIIQINEPQCVRILEKKNAIKGNTTLF